MDIRDLGKMINAPNVDKRKLKEMSPEIAEMAELFQQLAEIKNRWGPWRMMISGFRIDYSKCELHKFKLA